MKENHRLPFQNYQKTDKASPLQSLLAEKKIDFAQHLSIKVKTFIRNEVLRKGEDAGGSN